MTSSGVQVKRLHHVSLGTSNLPRLLAFYCEIMGSEVAHEFRNQSNDLYGAFVHLGNGTFIEMFRDENIEDVGVSRFRHLSLEVDDIELAAKFLESKGFALAVRRGRTDHVLQCFVEDPDGNIVELQQHDQQSVLAHFLSERGGLSR
jgi:catechol 2,3-dioxygenase-like lactoylglutathione lyase family enzyme